ncbi:MAG: SAM-dependent methyltransferase [Candidatus Electrothrix sp. GW3-4]|uniref:SAM-dependent methyltransferase n=1 Tax=Candidatus Electrothrix sp. GW3-4 TaxID=3126740 RepID=UPI0030D1D54F
MWRSIQSQRSKSSALLTALLWAFAFIAGLSGNATAAEPQQQTGSFKVVGVGPGDGDLLTLRAVKAIEDAEVVFCSTRKQEGLASAVDFSGKEVIDGYGVLFWHYGKECSKNEVKHFKQRMSCEEYHAKQAAFARMVRNAVAQGKDVVMLSSGDPTIYGPDIWTLRELSELDTELIPGLSAFNAANAALEASLGEVIITAPFISKDGEQDSLEQLSAHEKATMVIFMPWDIGKTFQRLAKTYPAETPAAVVSNAGMTGKEKAVLGTVGSFAADSSGLDGNRSIIYVGERLEQAQFTKTPDKTAGKGKYYLVGMGPGDPDLASLRAMKVIQEADIIFSGEKIKKKFQEVLKGKEVISGYHRLFPYYGKTCSNSEDDDKRKNGMNCQEYHQKQEEFAARVRKAVAEGKTVAMLDSGDPLVYGPCSWSITELKDLDTEVVPGVSCFNAANAALKAGVTEGKTSHSVILASGWTVDEMARHQSTMVLFTMRNEFKKFIDTLTKYYSPDTPAAVVVRAGYAQNERVVHGTLGTMLDQVGKKKLPFEYMLYVGDFLKTSPDRIPAPTVSQSL